MARMYDTSNYASSGSSSHLERIASYASPSYAGNSQTYFSAQHHAQPQLFYHVAPQSQNFYSSHSETESFLYNFFKSKIHIEYSFDPNAFLLPGRQPQRFIGTTEEIKRFVEEAFRQTLSIPFPDDLTLTILNNKDFRKLAPDQGVIGFSINRKEQGLVSEIFILNDELDRVMLTIGHELGHVISPPLHSRQNEEAKAFAFAQLWMKTIKQHNIANLATAITLENPAQNGLHDVAFSFVAKLMRHGKSAKEIVHGLLTGALQVKGYTSF